MNAEEDPQAFVGAVSASEFATTHWSMVVAAGETQSPESAAALETLCRAYWVPLYAYVRRQGASPEEAQDLTQLSDEDEATGKDGRFERLKDCVWGSESHQSYTEIGAELGLTEGAVKTMSIDCANVVVNCCARKSRRPWPNPRKSTTNCAISLRSSAARLGEVSRLRPVASEDRR